MEIGDDLGCGTDVRDAEEAAIGAAAWRAALAQMPDADGAVRAAVGQTAARQAVIEHRTGQPGWWRIPAHLDLPAVPGRWLTEEEVLTGSIVGRDLVEGRIIALVDVVDPEPPGTYGAWGVL